MPSPRSSASSASPLARRLLAAAVPLIVLAALAAWLWPRPDAEGPGDRPATADGPLVLTPQQLASQGIVAADVAEAAHYPLPGLAAEASAPLDASARVVVPYAGVITRLLVDEGAMVERGQALASIQSREALAAQAALVSARSEALAASSQARRDAELLAAGVVPAARDEQSRARASAAQGALRHAEGAFASLRMADSGMPGEYLITAPMAGQVLRRDVDTGQAVDALASAFLIATPGPLDVRFNLPVQYRSVIATGQALMLSGGGRAVVQAIGADTDPLSQSLRVRARLDDAGMVMAGQQFSATLQVPAPQGSLRIPASALLPAGTGHIVYGIDEGRITPVAVQQVLGTDGTHTVIQAKALQAGQHVVSQGTALLKAMVPATTPVAE